MDYGAESAFGKEYEIVAQLVDAVDYRFYKSGDAEVSLVPTPRCSPACVPYHPLKEDGTPSTHLTYTIDWINDNRLPRGDIAIAIHMDDLGSESASGACVVYDNGAPDIRAQQALAAAKTLAGTLGITCRGAMPDNETHRKHIGFVEKTMVPAFIFEMGNICNPNDVQRVKECGADAIVAATETLRTWKP